MTTQVDYASVLESMTEKNTDLIQKSATSRKLEEVDAPVLPAQATPKVVAKATTSDQDMFDMQIRNILIFLPIVLVFILYYSVMSIVDMSITKSSLLYAKYGSSKTSVQAN